MLSSLCRPAIRAVLTKCQHGCSSTSKAALVATLSGGSRNIVAAVTTTRRNFAGKAIEKKADAADAENDEDAISEVTEQKQGLQKKSNHLLWESPEAIPAPYMPKDVTELTAVDPADLHRRVASDGTDRFVVIRQDKANIKQSPLNEEKKWRIQFTEDGVTADKWTNSLMKWTSNADSFQSEPPLYFDNAKDAVLFAKKRGWRFLIKEPIKRRVRDDDVQYQDNFLPQSITTKIAKEKTQCDHWQRSEAATSHYFRPVRYHGKGVVRQHGPTMHADIAPHADPVYKLR